MTGDGRPGPGAEDSGPGSDAGDRGAGPGNSDRGAAPDTDETSSASPAAQPEAAGSGGRSGQQAAAASEVAGREAVPLLAPRDGLPPLVVTAEALDAAARSLGAGSGPVAVDAERASGFRYGHRAFLVQFRRLGAGTMLIDPVACPDLSAIDSALADAEAVLHAASQDLPCLAEIGYRPRKLFDTELAGRLLGYPRVGLGTLVEAVLGLALEKSHSAADWSTRPLPDDWLRYAALDVEVLVELRDALVQQLDAQGKSEWARQEFAAILAAGPPPPRIDPWRRTSGIHRVRSRRGPRRPGSCPMPRSSKQRGHCPKARRNSPGSPGSTDAGPGGTPPSGCGRSGGPGPNRSPVCPSRPRRPATGHRPRTAGTSVTPPRPPD